MNQTQDIYTEHRGVKIHAWEADTADFLIVAGYKDINGKNTLINTVSFDTYEVDE